MKPVEEDLSWAYLTFALLVGIPSYFFIEELTTATKLFFLMFFLLIVLSAFLVWFVTCSQNAKEKEKRMETYNEIPENLKTNQKGSVILGKCCNLATSVYLPESIRSRHVHIIGSTGSGKTESVVLNLLKQDIAQGRGAIILDAKGDNSFQWYLKRWLDPSNLKIFDLSTSLSDPFNPLRYGSPLEAAQRLHASLTWSEDYYKSKALTALFRLFENHFEKFKANPTLVELNRILYNSASFVAAISADSQEKKVLAESYDELAGLCDQIKALSLGNMQYLLSPEKDASQINLADAFNGKVIYCRLQNLISPQSVASIGKLIINNINYMAGTAHRMGASDATLVPIYLDEFAAFACPEFSTLISMARSAKFALHFSHQSIGDLMNVDKGFINQITDNSGTKIVMRVNDPDTAEYFAKSFGTKEVQKVTQRITKTEESENGELVGEGSSRDAHKFRAAPDLLKTLPTGMAACLIAHGEQTKEGASHVFKLKFPRLEENE